MSTYVKKKVTVKSRTKALAGNYRRCTVKDVHPHVKFVMTDKIHEWYFMLGIQAGSETKGEFSGDNDEFLGGQFIGKIIATNMYPYGPPDVIMLTPTGVFPLNNKDFCIDIGKYHKSNYPPTLGMDGYVKMIWSGLIGWRSLGYGINLLTSRGKDNVADIIRASQSSIAYNERKNADVLELFKTAENALDSKDSKKAVKAATASMAGMSIASQGMSDV
jgi:ubiquitin-protein ligase